MNTIIQIYFDGACHNKKGESSPMGMGVAVFINGQYEDELSLAWGAVGDEKNEDRGTSNVSEWLACVKAWQTAKELKKVYPDAVIRIYSDSQVITNQFNGTYTINKQEFKKYKNEAHLHSKGTGCKEILWIERKHNKQADILSKEGLQMIKDYISSNQIIT